MVNRIFLSIVAIAICNIGLIKPNHLFGQTLRKSAKSDEPPEDNNLLSLKEYLDSSGIHSIKNISNLTQLVKEKPSYFFKFVLEAAPKTPQTIEDSLESFYVKNAEIESLISSIPDVTKAHGKLANVFIENEIWKQIDYQVFRLLVKLLGVKACDKTYDQISFHMSTQVWGEIGDFVDYQIEDLDWDQTNEQLVDAMDYFEELFTWEQLCLEVKDQIKDQISNQVWDLINDHVFEQLNINLRQWSNLNKSLKPAVDYLFMVYQLGSVAIRHSNQMKLIHSNIANLLKNGITTDKLNDVLECLRNTIPKTHEKILIDSQLKMIHMHLN